MQGREKISDKDLPNLIREGLRHAFMHVESLHSDGVTKIGKNHVSLIDLENRAAGLYSNKELHDLYQHPERDKERGVLILDRIESDEGRATISRRVTTEGLRDTFGVINSELLNFRQQALVNAAIFEVTTNILGKLMAANPLDPKSNARVEKATRAALKNIDFTKLGMENPGDNKPRNEFIAAFNLKPKMNMVKKPAHSKSDPPHLQQHDTSQLRRHSLFSKKNPTATPQPLLQPKSEIDVLKNEIQVLENGMKIHYNNMKSKKGGADTDDLKYLKKLGDQLKEMERKLHVLEDKQKTSADINEPKKSPRSL